MKFTRLFFSMIAFVVFTSTQVYAAKHTLKIDDKFTRKHGSGPIIITGYDLEGTLTEPAITITTNTPVIIERSTLKGPGILISANNADVTVLHTEATGTNPNVVGATKGAFLSATNCVNIDVEDSKITSTGSGIYLGNYTGSGTHSQTVRIIHNTFSNMDNRASDGNGGYTPSTSPPYVHTIQLAYYKNLVNAEIAWNEMTNDAAQSSISNFIDFLDSGGSASSHFLVHDNFFRGAYSGGTINTRSNTGDGVNDVPAFIDIYNNQIIGAANFGIQISTGHDISGYNNRIISSGYTNQGGFIGATNGYGLINNNVNNEPATIFFNNNLHDNLSGFINTTGRGDWSLSGQNNDPENNTQWLPTDNVHPTLTDEQAEYQLWLQKIGSNHISLGTK